MKLLSAAMLMTLALVAATASCVEDPETVVSDQANILQLLAGSGDASMGDMDGQGPGGSDLDGIWPEFWWRTRDTESTWDLAFSNDPSVGICTVTVSLPLEGTLHIDVVHDGILDPGTKPFVHLRRRQAIVERTGESTDPYGGWELTHITPAVHTLEVSEDQEVFVSSMSAWSGDDLLWACDDPSTFYPVEDGLPVLEPGTLVRLEAEVLHTNPVYQPPLLVYAHGPCPVWPRHWMNDDGLFGDRVAGDGVYAYEWYAEESSEHWYIAVDVIDADTMLDQTEDDYDAGGWMIAARKS